MDVLSSLDTGMNARDDESHLIFAAGQGREIVRRMLRVASSRSDLTNGLYYLSNF